MTPESQFTGQTTQVGSLATRGERKRSGTLWLVGTACTSRSCLLVLCPLMCSSSTADTWHLDFETARCKCTRKLLPLPPRLPPDLDSSWCSRGSSCRIESSAFSEA